MNENLTVTGDLDIELIGPDGQVKQAIHIKNLVVTAGRNFVASRMINTAATAMSHMAIGSGNTAAALGDTALGTELARVALSGASNSANQNTYSASFGPGVGTGTVREAGIFNANSGGTMLNRALVTPEVVKNAPDTLNVNWTVSVN